MNGSRLGWAALFFIAVATFIAYAPALDGEMLWDDSAHIPQRELQSVEGLARIWFDVGATQQYYPLLFSSFWLQHRLWGEAMVGYHVVNVLLHVGAAFLVYLILRRLEIPGALLAAMIFALHPVHVESVAWVTEQKNTLSAVFYLGAMLAYLHFDRQRTRSWYALALALFVVALLSKTVTVTLPPALLVIFWWQRGTISWKRDVAPLLPFFALSATNGLLTFWVERRLIGAEGTDYATVSFARRALLAGRASWFYLEKLLWPANLTFVYPRWQLDPAQLWQWLYPAAAIGTLAALWAARKKARAPLAGALFFLGTLFPVLGFLNVFFFRYAYVSDHFQYLASLGIIVLVASGVTLALKRFMPSPRNAEFISIAAVCIVLIPLVWQACAKYQSNEVLWRDTLAKNPDATLAHNNMGIMYAERGQPQESLAYFERVAKLHPDWHETLCNYGTALDELGRSAEALNPLMRAIELRPDYARGHNNLALALRHLGRLPEAEQQHAIAVVVDPKYAIAWFNLGTARIRLGREAQGLNDIWRARELAATQDDTSTLKQIDAWLERHR